MTETSIRPGTTQDGAAVAAVFAAARAGMGYLPALHTADEDRTFLTAQLEQHCSHLALRGEELLGFAIHDDRWLHHLYVRPDAQSAGVGAALLARVKACRPAGFQLWCFLANTGARRFYERHGCICEELTDGAANEEKLPDVRYRWPGTGA